MNRSQSVPALHAALTWLLVALMVEPQTQVLGQHHSPYVRALEVLLTPNPTPVAAPPILLAQAQAPLPLLGERAVVRADASSSPIPQATEPGVRAANIDTNLFLDLTRTPITLTNGSQLLALSFFSDSNHNYVVEFRDQIGSDLCNQWQPLANAPHNYGIVFATNTPPQRFFRLRRIDQPRAPLFALLANDTGTNSNDAVTSDPAITGLALQFPPGTPLQAALDDTNGTWTTVTTLGAPRYFLINSNQLANINGGSLPDGPHTLFLRAGGTTAAHNVSFVFDTTPPMVSLQLASDFDSAPVGDSRTTFNPVNLTGQTEPGQIVELLPSGLRFVADTNGFFTLTNITLAQGTNHLFLRALDAACNEALTEHQVCWYGSDCTFPDNLNGWTVEASAASGGAAGSVTVTADKSCATLMSEGDSFLVTLSRSFQVSAVPATLNVTYETPTFDTSATGLMRDAFEVALVDGIGRPLTFTIQG